MLEIIIDRKRSSDTFFDKHIEGCIKKYKSGHSKLNTKAKSMEGMIGPQARNLLNLLADFDGCRYMQIGTWKGACLYSALYENNIDYALACDNFSQYSADPNDLNKSILDFDSLLNLMQPDKEDETVEFEFYNGNCWGMPLGNIEKPINMYFYDGGHNVGDHFLSLYYYYPVLDNNFIFVCDDWKEEKVRAGTYSAIMQCKYSVSSSFVYENLYIAHLEKNVNWGASLMTGRLFKTPTYSCKLTSKNIIKEPTSR
tara:strand:- start:124 stop:888 length:765 start_codon:yes stop_codon:yes gene_type:complete